MLSLLEGKHIPQASSLFKTRLTSSLFTPIDHLPSEKIREMPPPTRLFLLNLPRELRQHILSYVFEDAVEKDNLLNDFLRNDLRHSVKFSKLPTVLSGHLARVRWLEFDPKKIYAPHIYNLANNLTSDHPEVATNVPFVLTVAMAAFEKNRKEVMELVYLPKGNKDRGGHLADEAFRGCPLLFEIAELVRAPHSAPLVLALRIVDLMKDYGII